jgi:type IV secretion system protein VirB10
LIPLIAAVVIYIVFVPDQLKIKKPQVESVDYDKQDASFKSMFEQMHRLAERDLEAARREEQLIQQFPEPAVLAQKPANASETNSSAVMTDQELAFMVMVRTSELQPQGSFRVVPDEEAGPGDSCQADTETVKDRVSNLNAQRQAAQAHVHLQAVEVPGKSAVLASDTGVVQLSGAGFMPVQSGVTHQSAPSSELMLTQSTIVRTVLLGGINSGLPGTIVARVTSDVYDSLSGRHILIPKGSLLAGTYASGAAVGQERIFIAMHRMILPDGTSISLLGDSAADMSGYAGLQAEVNNHFWKMFSSSAIVGLSSLLLSKPERITTTSEYDSAQASGSVIAMAMRDTINLLLERNKNIVPTLTVDQGHPFILMLSRDVVMKPYIHTRK